MIPTWKDIVLVCFCWARRLADSRRRPADRHKRQVACVQHPLPHCRVFVVGRGRPYTTVDKNLVLEYFRPGFPEILGLIAFLFTLFKGCRCNQLYVITPDNFLWEPEKKNFKFHLNWGNTGENLHASDFILWNLKLWKFVFSGSHKNLFFRVISCNLLQWNVKECDTVEPVLSGHRLLSGRFFKVPKIASLVNWSTVISTPGGGGALGYSLGTYVPPGTPNWHPVLKTIPLKLKPHSRNGPIFYTRSRIRPKTETPF